MYIFLNRGIKMTKYINEETLRKLMYEEAFEKDSDM